MTFCRFFVVPVTVIAAVVVLLLLLSQNAFGTRIFYDFVSKNYIPKKQSNKKSNEIQCVLAACQLWQATKDQNKSRSTSIGIQTNYKSVKRPHNDLQPRPLGRLISMQQIKLIYI